MCTKCQANAQTVSIKPALKASAPWPRPCSCFNCTSPSHERNDDMKGAKEILLSFAVGSASLFTYAQIKRSRLQERSQPVDPPIASSGPSADPNLSLAWGLQEVHAPDAWRKHQGS